MLDEKEIIINCNGILAGFYYCDVAENFAI